MKLIVAMCCLCEKVRDDTETEPGGGLWEDFTFYLASHKLGLEEVRLSHAYCPDCLRIVRTVPWPAMRS